MIVFIYLIFIQSTIPEQFQELANKAIINSRTKVPKNLREDTKYPGNYSFDQVHFTLYKILSSSSTNDIKGYAIEDEYAAIVKRKKFNLTNEFAFIDLKKEEFYEMEEVIASDDKINIYKIKEVQIFNIFSDIVYKSKTPLKTFKHGFNWDYDNDRPILKKDDNGFSYGVGALMKAKITAKVRFRSIKKAEISLNILLEGKIGLDLGFEEKIYIKKPDITILNDIDIPIPKLSIGFKFLGLKFEFGVYLTFGAIFRNIEANLQVDLNYAKMYKFTVQRYISLTTHGSYDTGWQTEFSIVPSKNIVDGITSSLEASYITAGLDFKQGVKLKVTVAFIKTDLQVGIVEQFKVLFGFSPISCPFPYLYGQIQLPLSAYIQFSGINVKVKIFHKKIKIKLIKPISKQIPLFKLLKTKKYCLFDFRNNNDYDIVDIGEGSDDDYDPYANETSNRIIKLDVNNLKNLYNTNSLISFQISLSEYNFTSNSKVQLFSRRESIFEDITSSKSNFNTLIVANNQHIVSSVITISFYYYTDTNAIQKSNEASFFLKDYHEKDNGYMRFMANNPKKTENISIDLNLKYCDNLTMNDMYIPLLKYGAIEGDLEYGDELCLIVKDNDKNASDYVDENATFITDGAMSDDFIDSCTYTHNDEHFQIQLVSINLPSLPDSGTYVNYQIGAQWGENNENEVLLFQNFSKSFKEGINFINDDLSQKVRFTQTMHLFSYISYFKNNSLIEFKQLISYSEILMAANSESSEININQDESQVSCNISIKRYKPIILINSSRENSTHRIITNIYDLDSFYPSNNKPHVFNFKNDILYGVFRLKKIDPRIKWVIIHMPMLQPLCNFSMINEEYFQIPFDKETLYIPFRRQNQTSNTITIKHVIQGCFVDEETLYFSEEYYNVDFEKTPVVLCFVPTVDNEYSVYGIENTQQTLFDYDDEYYQILALEYKKDKKITIFPSLIIIDQEHPIAEKTIPQIPNCDSVMIYVWCNRSEEIIIHDKTTNITIENNKKKHGLFYELNVPTNHIIDFIPICNPNTSITMCYFKQIFDINSGYAIFKYPDKSGIKILDTTLPDLYEQEDREGLIEEIIEQNKNFYYMKSFEDSIQITSTYKEKIDLELRVIDVTNKYKKFCLYDNDGYNIPFTRSYYTDEYFDFMREFGIDEENERYLDFTSGDNDSCMYAYYDTNYTYNNESDSDTIEPSVNILEINDNHNLLYDEFYDQLTNNFSTKICDIAKSIKVLFYKDITSLVPPANFDYQTNSRQNEINGDKSEIDEYFIKLKREANIKNETNSLCVLYLSVKQISFNSELNDDEYISSRDDLTIRYRGGNLNIIIHEHCRTTINLGNSNTINLNVYGNGELKIINEKHSTIYINGTININSNQIIHVKNSVKSIQIERVNVAQNCIFYAFNENSERKVNISIKNLTLLENSRANLSYVEVSDTLFIKQTATAFFDETDNIENATLLLEMIYYQNDLIPMISGSISKPPNQINILHNSTENIKNLENEYLIFDGKFDCNEWVDTILLNNSCVGEARCASSNIEDFRTMSLDSNRTFISFVKKKNINKTNVIYDIYIPKKLITLLAFCVLDVMLLISIIVLIIMVCRRKNQIYSSDCKETSL